VNRALPAEEITYFVASLARRIATFPAETIALVKQAVDMADAGIEDDLVREETIFFRSVHTDAARRRMAAAMAAGLQSPVLEKCCFDHIWGRLLAATPAASMPRCRNEAARSAATACTGPSNRQWE